MVCRSIVSLEKKTANVLLVCPPGVALQHHLVPRPIIIKIIVMDWAIENMIKNNQKYFSKALLVLYLVQMTYI